MALPSIIMTPDDVYAYYLLDEEPNFVTQSDIVAGTAVFDGNAARGFRVSVLP